MLPRLLETTAGGSKFDEEPCILVVLVVAAANLDNATEGATAASEELSVGDATVAPAEAESGGRGVSKMLSHWAGVG